ncbi:hypothetical protein PIB30_021010 [Stylosanthes scabra]|uniref:Uncharacterized protein n=1 Tax=Stylosanthes scabra TaxID=79078 RepID=A0ABU6T8G7_9FABA|nr:hypothetical protein [Stylosanthes scabra]
MHVPLLLPLNRAAVDGTEQGASPELYLCVNRGHRVSVPRKTALYHRKSTVVVGVAVFNSSTTVVPVSIRIQPCVVSRLNCGFTLVYAFRGLVLLLRHRETVMDGANSLGAYGNRVIAELVTQVAGTGRLVRKLGLDWEVQS